MTRRFLLVRHADPTGISGTGVVAHGVLFKDGAVALRWFGPCASTTLWESVDDLIAIHGHSGATTIRWVDTTAYDYAQA